MLKKFAMSKKSVNFMEITCVSNADLGFGSGSASKLNGS